MHPDVDRVLIGEPALRARVATLADEISAAYPDAGGGITVVSVLAGSMIFAADLIRCLPMHIRIGLVTVSSYPGTATTPRPAVLQSAFLPELSNREVLIVDDILDSGATLRLIQAEIRRAGPRSVKTAVLLRKRGKAGDNVPVEFVGFDIEDSFVVGYGLDYNGLYRNLPYIAVLRQELYRGRS